MKTFAQFIDEANTTPKVKAGQKVKLVFISPTNSPEKDRGEFTVTKVSSNHFEIDRIDSITNKPMKFKHNGFGHDYKKIKSGRVKGLSRTSGHIVRTSDDNHLGESVLNEATRIVNTKDTD